MQSAKAFAGKLVTYLPDRPYTYLLYYRVVGERLSLKNPQQFTQKIQWLKLNGRLERFARFADKYTVRSYVEETVGAKHLIPLIGVWDSVDQIPFDTLPNSFVLKLTKGCGFNYICKDKSSIDIAQVKALLNDWMGQDFYRQEREPQYKPGRQRIIAEAYMEDADAVSAAQKPEGHAGLGCTAQRRLPLCACRPLLGREQAVLWRTDVYSRQRSGAPGARCCRRVRQAD
jgi:hypothetical protein